MARQAVKIGQRVRCQGFEGVGVVVALVGRRQAMVDFSGYTATVAISQVRAA